MYMPDISDQTKSFLLSYKGSGDDYLKTETNSIYAYITMFNVKTGTLNDILGGKNPFSHLTRFLKILWYTKVADFFVVKGLRLWKFIPTWSYKNGHYPLTAWVIMRVLPEKEFYFYILHCTAEAVIPPKFMMAMLMKCPRMLVSARWWASIAERRVPFFDTTPQTKHQSTCQRRLLYTAW